MDSLCVRHFNVAAGKGVADFNIYKWVLINLHGDLYSFLVI